MNSIQSISALDGRLTHLYPRCVNNWNTHTRRQKLPTKLSHTIHRNYNFSPKRCRSDPNCLSSPRRRNDADNSCTMMSDHRRNILGRKKCSERQTPTGRTGSCKKITLEPVPLQEIIAKFKTKAVANERHASRKRKPKAPLRSREPSLSLRTNRKPKLSFLQQTVRTATSLRYCGRAKIEMKRVNGIKVKLHIQ